MAANSLFFLSACVGCLGLPDESEMVQPMSSTSTVGWARDTSVAALSQPVP